MVLNGLPLCATPCPQAAELVMENCEAYEAHMRGIRDYLEERLVVSAVAWAGQLAAFLLRGAWAGGEPWGA